MKILMTNNTLSQLAGTEIFIYTLAKALIFMGHEIHVIPYDDIPEDSKLANRMREIGVRVHHSFETLDKDYDVIHCHHNNITQIVNYHFPETPKIFVSHGIYFDVCVPNKDIKFKQVIAVSEEVQDFLDTKHGIRSIVINNPIDTDTYCYLPRVYEDKPQKICYASNHAGKQCKKMGLDCEAFKMYQWPYFLDYCMSKCPIKPLYNINELAKHCKAFLYNVGYTMYVDESGQVVGKNNVIWDVDKAYAEADLVVGIGRSALNAISMGIPTLIYDHFGYVGFASEELLAQARITNLSGRTMGRMIGEFPELKPYKMVKEWRQSLKGLAEASNWVINNYSYKLIAKKYEQVYRNAAGL